MLACVTAGFRAPGVQRGSGRASSPLPRALQAPAAGWRCTTWALAVLKRSPLGARDPDTVAAPATATIAPVIAIATTISQLRDRSGVLGSTLGECRRQGCGSRREPLRRALGIEVGHA